MDFYFQFIRQKGKKDKAKYTRRIRFRIYKKQIVNCYVRLQTIRETENGKCKWLEEVLALKANNHKNV